MQYFQNIFILLGRYVLCAVRNCFVRYSPLLILRHKALDEGESVAFALQGLEYFIAFLVNKYVVHKV